MKKLIVLFVFILAGFGGVAKAETTYFFQNGSGYNIQGELTHYRFMDGKCYDIKGTYTPECSAALPSNVITPIDLPDIIPPVNATSTEPTSTPQVLPPNVVMGGVTQHTAAGQSFIIPACDFLSSTATTATFECQGDYDIYSKENIIFNGQTIITNGIGQTEYGPRIWYEADNLTPNTEYSYQIIYTDGGNSSIMNKSFTTKPF